MEEKKCPSAKIKCLVLQHCGEQMSKPRNETLRKIKNKNKSKVKYGVWVAGLLQEIQGGRYISYGQIFFFKSVICENTESIIS